jgi:hypothetical protein
MTELIKIILRFYHLYNRFVAVLLPLMIITFVGLFVDHLPYINLYKDIVLTSIFAIDWFVILWLSRIRPRMMFVVGFLLFTLTYPLHYLKLNWYVETLSNLCYIIFVTGVVFEFSQLLFNRSELVTENVETRSLRKTSKRKVVVKKRKRST